MKVGENKKIIVHTHQYYEDGIVQFENQETLFGKSGCIYGDNSCERHFLA